MAIKQPFGTSLNPDLLGSVTTLTKVLATNTAKEFTITTMLSFLRIATATKGKTLKFFADDDLPAGALIMISAQSASSEILLSSGFAGKRAWITGASAAKGTGTVECSLMYDGADFRWLGRHHRTK
jgi:hypothetical protein